VNVKRLHPLADHATLLDAMARVHAARPDATLLIAGCGSSGKDKSSSSASSTASAPAAAAPAAAKSAIAIASFKYSPESTSVASGAKITVDNRDTAEHTITADDNSFDSGTVAAGGTKTFTVSRAGTFKYHCAFHPFMHGELTVK